MELMRTQKINFGRTLWSVDRKNCKPLIEEIFHGTSRTGASRNACVTVINRIRVTQIILSFRGVVVITSA